MPYLLTFGFSRPCSAHLLVPCKTFSKQMAGMRKRRAGNQLIVRAGWSAQGILGQTLVNQVVATNDVRPTDWDSLMNELLKEQLSKEPSGFIRYIIENTTLRIHENILGFLYEEKIVRSSRDIWEVRYESCRHLSGRARIC